MLDVTRLRVLVAVARCGSVTAAARALNYAQPSVSHHLARLEAETGTKLIQRAGRGIRLTDAGRLLAERAAEVIGRLDAAENELAAYTGLRAGRPRPAGPCCASSSPASTCGSPRPNRRRRCACCAPGTRTWPWCSGTPPTRRAWPPGRKGGAPKRKVASTSPRACARSWCWTSRCT